MGGQKRMGEGPDPRTWFVNPILRVALMRTGNVVRRIAEQEGLEPEGFRYEENFITEEKNEVYSVHSACLI